MSLKKTDEITEESKYVESNVKPEAEPKAEIPRFKVGEVENDDTMDKYGKQKIEIETENETKPQGISSKDVGTDDLRNSKKISAITEALQARLTNLKNTPVREEGDFTTGCTKLCNTRIRFILMVLVLLCLASIWSNILSFNFALICIKNDYSQTNHNQTSVVLNNVTLEEDYIPENAPIKIFNSRERLYLTSAVAASALVTNFAVVAFVGIAFAANFPVIGSFTSKWTYYKQNGLFVSALVAYVQLSPAITMPISGTLCELLSWSSVFYFHGSASIVLFILFGIFYRNSPGKHPFVGDVELRKIAVGKSELGKEALKIIPYAEILKTKAVWAVWIAAIGNFFCVNMMFLYSPSYLNSVLKYEVQHTGLSAALAPLAQFCIKLLSGFTSDKVRCLSETNKLRLYNSIAFFGSAFFMTILAFAPTNYPTLCLMLLGISAGMLGSTTGGFFKAGPLVSKHYSHFVTGNVSLGITLTMLFVPVMVTGLAPQNTAEQWRWVFLCTSAVLVITNIAFCVMCSAKAASWTTDEFSRNTSRNKIYTTQPNLGKLQPEIAMG